MPSIAAFFTLKLTGLSGQIQAKAGGATVEVALVLLFPAVIWLRKL
ncbi:hypothetical protein [Botryobacter ruber]|nr:hypothetical protein [Botryobacter ruber]